MELLTKQVFLEWFHKTQTTNLGIALVCFSMFFFFFLLLFEYIFFLNLLLLTFGFLTFGRVGAVPIPLSLLSCRSMPL